MIAVITGSCVDAILLGIGNLFKKGLFFAFFKITPGSGTSTRRAVVHN